MRTGTFLFLLLSFTGFSQSYNFRIYSIAEGVPQSQVHAIVQDHDGFLWFSTDGGGLLRFAGQKKTLYTTTEGLSNDLIYTLAEDADGKLWIGTAKGLNIFYKNHFEEVPAALKPLMDLTIRTIFIDSIGGKIRFGTLKGAFVYDGKTLERVKELGEKPVLSVCKVPRESMEFWYGTLGDGLYRISGTKVDHFSAPGVLPSNTVSALHCRYGVVAAGTDNGIVLFGADLKTEKLPLPAPPTAKQVIRTFYTDNSDNLWVGTSDCGIYKVEMAKTGRLTPMVHYGRNEGLGIDGVFCITQDREGNMWIGTDGNGAACLGPQTFSSIGKQNGMPEEMILSMCRDSRGCWWYGNDDGLTYYDGKNYTHYDGRNGLTNEKVWHIIEDKQGKIWCTTYGSGIFVCEAGNPGTVKQFKNYTEKDGLPSNNLRSVFQDSKGRIWAGTANGLGIFNGKGFSPVPSFSKEATRFLSFFEDSKHRLWIGSANGGIALLTNDDPVSPSYKVFSEKEGMADNVILSIDEDAHGNIWTGNFGGISMIDPAGKVKKITKKDGLSSNTVYAIKIDMGLNLMAGTNNGVDKFYLSDFWPEGKVRIKHFGKEEGFGGIECNTNSIYKDEEGRIYFGTVKGVFIYDPSKDTRNKTGPPARITNARLFFEDFDHSKYTDSAGTSSFLPLHMTLPYDQNHLTFDFVGLSMTIPERVQYRYKLEGFDKDFTPPSSESSATYSNLPAGDYQFQVIAGNEDGVWGKPEVFRFSITPPFWKTWWFRTIAAAAIIGGTYGFFRYRIRRMKRIQAMLKHQVALKTKELRGEKEIVEKQNKQITSSIHYAKRIQDSILPLKEKIHQLAPDSFIFFQPKDIVSGDFYWFSKRNGHTLVAAVDCTGHGVPGAFMSLIGNNLLNNIVNHQGISDPKIVLEKLHEGVVLALKKDEKESETVDGMDIALCVLDEKSKVLEFASSGRPLLLVRGDEVRKYKNGKHPVGLVTKNKAVFEKEVIPLKEGDSFYILTDGYCDQFGGRDEDKFMESNLEKLLLEIRGKSMNEQGALISARINAWKGEQPQLDDILVIGIRV